MSEVKPRIIEVTTALELGVAVKKKIESVFSAKHRGEKLEFVYHIDKTQLGGVLVVDGDKFYDGTLLSQVNKIDAANMMNEKLPSVLKRKSLPSRRSKRRAL